MTTRRNDATEAQVRAANPLGSAWLAANAGSGKTRVLTDRVARLLLNEVDPQQILCLTYTKAAATEMQNRLFKRLGAWAMQDTESLRSELGELGEDRAFSDADIKRARTLFARAIEVPGGLKIQTIHSFCASLLRRFPLEAGVNPQFEEMEQRAAQLLQSEIVDDMIADGDAARVQALMLHDTGGDFGGLLQSVVSNQDVLSEHQSWVEVAKRHGLDPNLTESDIVDLAFDGSEQNTVSTLLPALAASGANDKKLADQLRRIHDFGPESLQHLQSILLTQAGTPRKNCPAKAVQKSHPVESEQLQDLMERLADARKTKFALRGAQKTSALYNFATPFLRRYAAAKAIRGWLDFDDLILRSRALLKDDKVAAWVLYRLDGGISHLLVDEAQDTSPAQWDVIRLLTQEFTSGLSTHEGQARTLFVVGDKKQSIYSFQGADPNEFDRMEVEFGTKLRAINAPFSSQSLEYSFRSSDAILRLVDRTFEDQEAAGFVADQKHRAFHADMPGRVDLWPVIEKSENQDGRVWTDPVDFVPDSHHSVVLAQQVADQISQMLGTENPSFIPEKTKKGYQLRAVKAADILILVQRRSALFHEIIRACKQKNLPIAGADRLRVGAELAVRDLLAFLSFLATPEDSLSLATALRSPLFGWSEQQLFSLSHNRSEPHLWETFRKFRVDHEDAYSVIEDLRGKTDFLRPYDLLERILTKHEGRQNLLTRLGTEAEDGINAILSQALAYERSAIPSLTGFLIWAKADDLEIKRQVDGSGGLIRVMTVHGAKGLESPVVFMPDCGNRRVTVRDTILKDEDGAFWKMPSDQQTEAVETVVNEMKAAEERERQRLLYVAMTRAESWLIVGAAGELSKDGSDWYQCVERGMSAVGSVDAEYSFGTGRRYEFGNWDLPINGGEVMTTKHTAEVDPDFLRPVETQGPRKTVLSPSDLGGAKALAAKGGLEETVAKARGTYVHALLETLSTREKDVWVDSIEAQEVPKDLPFELIEDAQSEAVSVLKEHALSWIFDPDGHAEVPLQGFLGTHKIMGTIDRLIVQDDVVTAIDFKTNQTVPTTPDACPDGLLRQMGAYSEILRQIYPKAEVRTGILWTADKRYMSLPQNIVSDALLRTPYLDAGA